MKKIISIAITASIIFSTTACNMIEKTEDAINRSAVAKVNGEKITRGELDETLEPLFEQLEEQYGKGFKSNAKAKDILAYNKQQQLEGMILEVLIEQKAKELGVMPSEDEIKAGVEEYIKNKKELYDNEEEFNKALEEAKLTIEDLEKDAEYNVLKEKVYDEITKDVAVTDEKVKEYYEANKEAFTEEPNAYKISRILVKEEEEAKKVKERLDNGEDFAELAKEVSIDEKSKENGGDLGYVEYNDSNLGGIVMTAAKVLEVGKASDPINDATGWNIIKVADKKEYPVKKYDDVEEEIRTNLVSSAKYMKWTNTLGEWFKEADIKRYEENLNN